MSTAPAPAPNAPAAPAPPPPPRSPKVGLIGPSNAGKTTYFGILQRALTDRKWTVQTHKPGRAVAGRPYAEQIGNDISQGRFPAKTVFREQSEELYFSISKAGAVNLELSFYDPAGELFEPTDNPALRQEARNQLYEHMKDCDGFVVLMDPWRSPEQLLNIWQLSVQSFMGFLQERGASRQVANGKLRMRTAVVFTKADTLPWFQRFRPRDAGAYMEHFPGLRGVTEAVNLSCEKARFFFSSAVGWNQGRSNTRVAVFPPQLKLGQAAGGQPAGGEVRQGDLIPDPPVRPGEAAPAPHRSRPLLPVFTDPTQLVDDRSVAADDLGVKSAGVVSLPGRINPTTNKTKDRYLTPWHIVEPLLWAAHGTEYDKP